MISEFIKGHIDLRSYGQLFPCLIEKESDREIEME